MSNLFRPWLLARFSTGAAAAVLVVVGLFVAIRVLRHYRIARTSEGQLALERRAELAGTLIEVALGATIAGLALAVLGADRMTASIRGAMCAWGVLDASPWGFRSLALSAIAALACALWIALHRLDLRLRKPALTRAKFSALLVVAPLVLADFAAATAYALDLDLRVVASCCSTGLDAAREVAGTGASGGPRDVAAALFVVGSIAAIALALFTRARPSTRAASLVGVASLVAGLASVPAVVWWVAPHVYETPTHLCPFCLLHADVLGIGWPLFAAIFVATAMGLSAAMTGLLERASGEPETARALEARLATRTAIAWSLALAIALLPIARWTIVSGGASLFGS
ncbi:hypothetical protein [Sandaracinus amylolyticus]|uniref:Putative membrane protein n=1 Tax=Sandaracinus amylolyticus TaxID=927083 RepID=A0A0F6W7T6_9BACT|nr:hypothetical protein [Sandaracinus amylolyticus]AKF09617.1 Putative membrane protein [Sandaracinus amylolyticus]